MKKNHLEQEIKIQEIRKIISKKQKKNQIFFFSFQSQMALFLYVGIAYWY